MESGLNIVRVLLLKCDVLFRVTSTHTVPEIPYVYVTPIHICVSLGVDIYISIYIYLYLYICYICFLQESHKL